MTAVNADVTPTTVFAKLIDPGVIPRMGVIPVPVRVTVGIVRAAEVNVMLTTWAAFEFGVNVIVQIDEPPAGIVVAALAGDTVQFMRFVPPEPAVRV